MRVVLDCALEYALQKIARQTCSRGISLLKEMIIFGSVSTMRFWGPDSLFKMAHCGTKKLDVLLIKHHQPSDRYFTVYMK